MKQGSEGRLSARDWLDFQTKTGKASKYIRPFDVRPGVRVLIVARVSGCERERNLKDQEANLRDQIEAAGGNRGWRVLHRQIGL